MSTRDPRVQPVHVGPTEDGSRLRLEWGDGVVSDLEPRMLRLMCPCAGCVEEWSGKRTFEVDTIPEGMKVIDVQSVGNYALSFTFGDAHNTGIFQWEYLKELSTSVDAGK